jgi:DegV family protein with EDD domain
MAVRIITDTASGLPRDNAERLNIATVALYLNEGGSTVRDTDIDVPGLYARIAEGGPLPTTSQPTPEDFAAAFAEATRDGDDALAVLISAKMSGTMSAAELGAELVRQQHPGVRIALVDSESNSMQEGFAVLAAAECAQGGGDMDACVAAAKASVRRSRFLFAPRTLDYLARGGRISNAAALLGHMLTIAPILTAKDGTTGIAGVVRSHRRALERMAALLKQDVERCGLSRIFVQAVVELEEATAFAREFIEPIARAAVPVVPVPAVVGIHVGPAIGLAYETVEPLR